MTCHEPIKAHGALVSCAYCPGCRSKRSATWALRLGDEQQEWERYSFVTLTIRDLEPHELLCSDRPVPWILNRRYLQIFFKRLRIAGYRIKYFAVGEYGEDNARAHYHVILFGVGRSHVERVALEAAWPWGFVDIGNVEAASIRYVTGYVMKAPLGRLRLYEERIKSGPPFSVMSQKLGARGADRREHTITTQGVVRVGNRAVEPPRYYIGRLSEDGKRAFLSARRERVLKQALARVDAGGEYARTDKLDRAIVASRDHAARQRPRQKL